MGERERFLAKLKFDEMSQRQTVELYLEEFGSITAFEAVYDLGITRLSSIIYKLKKRGWVFETGRVNVRNRYNENCCPCKYTLIKKGDAEDDKQCNVH